MATMAEFQDLISPEAWGPGGNEHPGRIALRNVADTAFACHVWLRDCGLTPSAADVVAFTTLVIKEEHALKEAAARERSHLERNSFVPAR